MRTSVWVDLNAFEKYVKMNSRPMIPMGTHSHFIELLAVSNAFGGEAGELQNVVKKLVRDGVSAELYGKFVLEAGDCLHYLTRMVNSLGYTITEIQQANIDKLDARAREQKFTIPHIKG